MEKINVNTRVHLLRIMEKLHSFSYFTLWLKERYFHLSQTRAGEREVHLQMPSASWWIRTWHSLSCVLALHYKRRLEDSQLPTSRLSVANSLRSLVLFLMLSSSFSQWVAEKEYFLCRAAGCLRGSGICSAGPAISSLMASVPGFGSHKSDICDERRDRVSPERKPCFPIMLLSESLVFLVSKVLSIS